MKEFSKKISFCFMVLLGVLVMNLMVAERVRAADSDFIIDENGVLVEYVGSDSDVVIPEGVISIGNGVFSDCTNLINVIIPDSVTDLGQQVFRGCFNLKSVSISNSITRIGFRTFSGCSSLINIIIPESVTSIGNYAFMDCLNLTDITIPKTVTSVGDYTFRGCSSLTSITIPEAVTRIGEATFYACSSLTNIIIPEGVTSIGGSAFKNCTNLTSIVIPESVINIEGSAFSGCLNLTNIIIPEGVISIGDYSFTYCNKLENVIIYNDNIELGEKICGENNKVIILYGHKGSTTETYALQNGYNFKELEVVNPFIISNIVSIHPDKASMIGNNIEVSENTTIGMNLTITAGSGGKLSVQNGTGIELLHGQQEVKLETASVTSSAIEFDYLFDIRADEMDEPQKIVFTLENITGEVCEQIEYMISKKEPEPENKPLQSIRLSKTDINLVKDRTSLLKVFYDPEDTTDPRAVTWTSSNREVAIVYTNGKVKAIGKGTAVITAKVGNLTATCNVTVTE